MINFSFFLSSIIIIESRNDDAKHTHFRKMIFFSFVFKKKRRMLISKDVLLKSLYNYNQTIRTFALSSIHFRRRIKHPTYQYFPYQKYDSANPIPHRDRVPVWR